MTTDEIKELEILNFIDSREWVADDGLTEIGLSPEYAHLLFVKQPIFFKYISQESRYSEQENPLGDRIILWGYILKDAGKFHLYHLRKLKADEEKQAELDLKFKIAGLKKIKFDKRTVIISISVAIGSLSSAIYSANLARQAVGQKERISLQQDSLMKYTEKLKIDYDSLYHRMNRLEYSTSMQAKKK